MHNIYISIPLETSVQHNPIRRTARVCLSYHPNQDIVTGLPLPKSIPDHAATTQRFRIQGGTRVISATHSRLRRIDEFSSDMRLRERVLEDAHIYYPDPEGSDVRRIAMSVPFLLRCDLLKTGFGPLAWNSNLAHSMDRLDKSISP